MKYCKCLQQLKPKEEKSGMCERCYEKYLERIKKHGVRYTLKAINQLRGVKCKE